MFWLRYFMAGHLVSTGLLIILVTPSATAQGVIDFGVFGSQVQDTKQERCISIRQPYYHRIVRNFGLSDMKNMNKVYKQALEQEKQGNYQSAIDLYYAVETNLKKIIYCGDKRYSESTEVIALADVRRGLGRSYSLLCMHERAIDAFQDESSYAPNARRYSRSSLWNIELVLTSLQLASLYVGLGEYTQAVQEYRKLLDKFQRELIDYHSGVCEYCFGEFDILAYKTPEFPDFSPYPPMHSIFILQQEIYLRYSEALHLIGMESLAQYMERKAEAFRLAHAFGQEDVQKINPIGTRYHNTITKQKPCTAVKAR